MFALSVIIPCYNESRKIQRDISAAFNFLEDHGLVGEVIVVDDGSIDDTVEVARELSLRFANLRVEQYTPNRGKGYAIRRGVQVASGEVVMFADAGLCVPYDCAMAGLACLKRGVDIAVGSRRTPGSMIARSQPLYRRVGSKAFDSIVHWAVGLPRSLTDTQCGFKLFRKSAAKSVFGACTTDGFMIDIELLCRAHRAGLRVVEFPVTWANDSDTRFHVVRGTWRNLGELVRIRAMVGSAPRSLPSAMAGQHVSE